jgi:glucosamine--fructose-6-phosphate aminotransferase (isomerizing)
MYLIGLYMGYTKGTITEEYYRHFIDELRVIPDKLREVLKQEDNIHEMAKKLYRREQVFFIGRGEDCGVAYEGSLKLKEISYINSFAIAAGELKHGTIALIEQDTLVISLATQDRLFEKMLSNIQEIKARGATVIGLAKEGNKEIEGQANQVIYIPECMDEITPLLSVVPLQLLAYYIARLRGCDIDKPKNLAKSVTVE